MWTADRPLDQLLASSDRRRPTSARTTTAAEPLATRRRRRRVGAVAVSRVRARRRVPRGRGGRRWTQRAAVGVAVGWLSPCCRRCVTWSSRHAATRVMACAALAVFAVERTAEGTARVRPIARGWPSGARSPSTSRALTVAHAPLALVLAAGSLRTEARRLIGAAARRCPRRGAVRVRLRTNPTQIDWDAPRSFGESYRLSLQAPPVLYRRDLGDGPRVHRPGRHPRRATATAGRAADDSALVLAAGLGAHSSRSFLASTSARSCCSRCSSRATPAPPPRRSPCASSSDPGW